MLKASMALPVVAALVGCAAVPDVEYSYYLGKAGTTVTVTQTVACTADKSNFIVANSAAVATSYSADPTQKQTLRIKEIGGSGVLADSSIGVTFYDDGRLKGINQSTTGQGEAIVKATASLLVTAGALITSIKKADEGDISADCALIEKWGGGKPVTIVYSHVFASLGGQEQSYDFTPGSASDELRAQLRRLPAPRAVLSAGRPIDSGARLVAPAGSDIVPLVLQKTRSVSIDVSYRGNTFFSGTVVVPTTETYTLPIPKAALFGQQTFALGLSESGAITSISYASTGGTAGAINAINAGLGVENQTEAAKAAALKAQADVITQQQRLVQCRARPTECK